LTADRHILVSSAQILALSTWVSLGQPAPPYHGAQRGDARVERLQDVAVHVEFESKI
jgi:hypothetical protein